MSRFLYEIHSTNYAQDIGAMNEQLKLYDNITYIGIQGTPGATFMINGDENAIVLGNSGVFQMDLTYGEIPPLYAVRVQSADFAIPLIIHLIAEKESDQ